ncbi:ABC transporter permease [Flaviaesturariibacter amylovorans]|uniref:ABC transporter permease n=1 Tax=Flaviaesturariibacter amylovorans TaxID=1084520 RepID=A0ABP8HS11_9BACT
MNKILIIIKREYLSRVRKKSFILSTILTPLVLVAMIATTTYFTVRNIRNEKIAVVDPAGMLQQKLTSGKKVTYTFTTDADTSNFTDKGFSALLLAPGAGINHGNDFQLVSESSLSRFAHDQVGNDVGRALENNMISRELKVDPARIDSIKKIAAGIKVQQVKKSDVASGGSSSFSVQMGIGYFTAFLIYLLLFIYGMMVMRGVMEEKTNRIAEVIVSSVRPFELMMGKIIGIGAVGITQFLIWIVLLTGIGMALTGAASPDVLEGVKNAPGATPGLGAPNADSLEMVNSLTRSMATVNWPVVIGCFLFYFLGGYLFYAALFAAVGSAVNEDPQDVQSLTLPITLPIVIGIIIMVNSINDPNSAMATWASIIPFTSPIVMMSRVPFGVPGTVPIWELALSMILLAAGFLFTTWLCARIYRTGILMYGKKPTWKEMMKWVGRA